MTGDDWAALAAWSFLIFVVIYLFAQCLRVVI